ncbi:hypothetical protein INT48_004456 [Thamnidium elegans]|uniref:Histone deacetylase interacting domain-containing protein n=1 Tax=Thamnidium elegans TaxID=101142 RepID=A0A8H7SLF1_9FUNG|nr:hypothetical protein INT48_004456 [Thamnidium elegans]
MTIPNQLSQTDPRRPSVSTSSLPLVGSPYGHHHRLPNLSQQTPSYRTNSPPLSYHSRNDLPYQNSPSMVSSNYNSPANTSAGLVSANIGHTRPSGTPPPLLLKNNLVNHYSDHPQQQQHENLTTAEASPSSPNSSYRPLNVIDALAYLDQVKGQFSDKPNVYNQFLDIMKDFKSQSIDTPGVIDRVSTLFKGHPLLISGFNTFLPAGYRIECSIDPRDPNRIIVTTPNGNTTTSTTTTAEEMLKINPPHYYHTQQQQYTPPLQQQHQQNNIQQQQQPPPPPQQQQQHGFNTSVLPPPPPPSFAYNAPPTSTSPISSDRRPPVEFNHAINYVNRIKEQKPIQEVYAHVQYLFNGADDLLQEFKQFLPEINNQSPLPQPPKRKKYVKKSTRKEEPAEPVVLFNTFDPTKPTVSMQETELFEKIKKHIGTKPSYQEFLKTLNLYTQQIVDMDTLIVQLKGFFGTNKELFDAFKQAIGYDPVQHPIEKPNVSAAKPDLLACKSVKASPSYREVPKEWQNQPCSGRDQMCWEVLNDQYVSHPIWNSEDSGFVASKKNQYEEALHRCEEERYEYDLNIEANLNTIALIEPIALRIESMSSEEKVVFRLEPGLGGPTVSIYERIIKKIYDHDRGTEIIEMLYQKPAVVIPIVLKRLKMKDKEWKKAQREWNKIWRELDTKNFYRSLDYQGTTFKSNDKKALINKALITEIESLVPNSISHLVYIFQDTLIVKDISRLIFSYVQHQTGFTKSDKQKIRVFLSGFLPAFFYSDEDIPMEEDTQSNAEDSDTDTGSASPHNYQREKNGKLLRDVFMRNSQSNGHSPAVKMEQDMDGDIEMTDIMIQQGSPEQEEIKLFAPTKKKRSIYNFFCNSHYYCLFRLYQVLYERLVKMKSIDERVKTDPTLGKKFNSTAVELDLYSNRFEDVDLSNGYYSALLETIEHFFEGESDQQTFEEGVRYIFGIEAYTMFTIQTVAADRKSIELFKLFNEVTETRPVSVYRTLAESVLGGSDENMYKMNFDTDTCKTSIQLLDKEQKEEILTDQEKYQEYMTNYIDWLNETKGIDQELLKPSFLTRNLIQQEKKHAFVRPQLRYKIQQESYHMYYIVGSEDVFYRPCSSSIYQAGDGWNALLSKNIHLTMNTERIYK